MFIYLNSFYIKVTTYKSPFQGVRYRPTLHEFSIASLRETYIVSQ